MNCRVPYNSSQDWDINDSTIPRISEYDGFSEWADGHCRLVYRADSEEAKRHSSGWAMRNTNNHNVHILKKSCLGVLVCSLRCTLPSGDTVHLRPAICDKARKKQQGKPCPNRQCSGRLEILACRGHCGYPVTHFWRHTEHAIFFQAKGIHDHPKPEAKSTSEARRSLGSGRRLMPLREPTKRQCREIIQNSRILNPPPLINDQEKNYCSCPPFECICIQNLNHSVNHQYQHHSPASYQPAQNLESYWSSQDGNHIHNQQFSNDINVNLNNQYDFSNISADLFQPEEIFQLDQPIKPDFVQQNDIARSPPTLLDLGSGTIHREFKTEEYWQQNITNLVSDDSNNSSNSRLYFNSSPDNSQISLNNSPALSQNDVNYIGTKLEDVYNIPKYEYFNQIQDNDYKCGQFPEISDSKFLFGEDTNLVNNFETHYNKNAYKNYNFDSRFVEKYDAPQFVDYTAILNVCENKMVTNEAIFNELDLKINNSLSNFHYNGESFENLVTQP
ncbi:glial cells missing related/glide [Holotrichia oblita]|uniref:Glial cells missing related/glide n=1 Tax=Holotrichia oblita TaxID=644536 RepID=A0ACB9TDA1_HOLOL|nr:glial cells missing related/glide [Holotrichia oblita]